ncbi:MAG: TonB-dependent receptor [Bacteroidetes bacterium]|nr:TonB-dependent receptor [Bacteroidota bacterium]
MKKILLIALTALVCTAVAAQTRVTGTVTASEDGSPVSFATIAVKGSNNSITTTDLDGRFVFANIPGNAVLVVSFIGYTTQEVAVNNRTVVNITLSPSATSLEELMVVAYGTVKKASYSGSASVVKNETIKDVPLISVEQALAGSVPGMQITSNSGQPGADTQIRIRGVGSFNAGNRPLYVVDGIPITSGDWSDANIVTSSMNFLDPSNIETITVLKDAAAAALYGSRAANGVILITSKTGKQGRVVSTFKASVGFSTFAVHNYPLCNDAEKEMLVKETLRNTAADNESVWASYGSIDAYVNNRTEYYYPAIKPGYEYTKWYDQLFRTAVAQNYEASVSGGNADSRVFGSVAYTKTLGVSNIAQMNRISTALNASHKLNKFLTVGGSSQFSSTDQDGFQDEPGQRDSPWYAYVVKLTDRFPLKNPDGTYYLESYDGTAFRNPVPGLDKQIANSKQARVLLQGWAEASLLKVLKLKTTVNYDGFRVDDRFAWLVGHQYGEVYGMGYVGDRYTRVNRLVSSTVLNYAQSFKEKHNLAVMVGWEAESSKEQYSDVSKADFANYSLTSTDLASTVRGAYTINDEVSLLSLISNFNYDYDAKYYLSATFRRDGSSKLSPAKRWGNFWSASGSWRIINEAFMKDISWMNDLKIRGSYGVSGTLPSSYYGWQTTYDYSQYGDENISYPYSYADRNLTWETNYIWNVAIEGRVFNRFSFIAEYYNRTTKDLLLNASIPSTTGFTSTLRNVGSMLNRGVELSLNVDIIKKGDIQWSMGMNWNSLYNEILSLSREDETIPNNSFYIWKKGYSFYQYYTREYIGADPQTGAPRYYRNNTLADGTLNKEITNSTSSASSAIIEGKTGLPKGYGGINTNLSWKNLSLFLNFNYQYGNYVLDDTTDRIRLDGQNLFNNLSKEQLKRWQNPGDVTDVPRPTLTTQGGNYNSTRWIRKGDFLRLKSMTLSYSLPRDIASKLALNGARIYCSGSNLFTLTGLDFDPEVPFGGRSYMRVPPMKTITFGVEISF